MRRRRLGSRSKRYRRRAPSVLLWSLGVVAGVGVLVAVGYLHGKAGVEGTNFFKSLHKALAAPAVAALVASGGVLLIAWSVRNLVLEALSWWPGKVVVEDFVVGPEIEDANAARLTAAFRNRLAECHLQAPASVPAAGPPGNFLDVLSGGGADPGTLVASLVGMLRAALPDHAYRVKGVLVTREQEPRCGVTVQVERMPGQAGPARTFWRGSWEPAVARAADHATASILPRTRRCESPWAGWRGYHLPSRLLHNYERAAELEADRRFDEALEAYYDALKDDPMNLGLRLQIGFLQEKLALFLDAFATYEGILAVAQPGGTERDSQSEAKRMAPQSARGRRHRVDGLGPTYRPPARRGREQVLLVAQYRRAILLAGREFPRQWSRGAAGAPNRRDEQRAQLRKRLRPRLVRELTSAVASDLSLMREVKRLIGEPASTRVGQEPAHDLQLDLACVQAADVALAKLALQAPRWSLRKTCALTRSTVDLSRLWIEQRLACVERENTHTGDDDVEPPASDVAATLTERIGTIEKRHGFRRWQDHYNAACIYALPLLSEEHDDADERLARLAVDRLERAIECADSGFIASHRDWVLADDPDLEGLRARSSFKQFEAMFFPSPARTRTRPPGLHRWELSRYTIDLLSATAERWELLWEARKAGLQSPPEPHDLLDWCELETEAWDRVQDVACNHRHWRTRVKLIEQLGAASGRCGFEPLAVGFPRFADATELGDVPDGLDVRVRENDKRLRALAATTGAKRHHACRLISDLQMRRASLGLIDAPGWRARKADIGRICDAHASLWRTLRRYLEDDAANVARFKSAVEATCSAWVEAEARWPTRGPAPARRRRAQQVHTGRRRRPGVRS